MTTPDELRRLLESAGCGPVTLGRRDDIDGSIDWIVYGARGADVAACFETANERAKHNAALIVAAVNSLPGLLDELERLRRHYDAAAPEHNLLELLDLYHEREMAARAEAERLRTENAELREALRPFARMSMARMAEREGDEYVWEYERDEDESGNVTRKVQLTLGDFKRAAALVGRDEG